MGLEKKLTLWTKPDPVYNQLKQLTRERGQLQKLKTSVTNQLHAEKTSAWTNSESIKRGKRTIKWLEKQIAEIEGQIKSIIESNSELKRKIEFMTSIKGIGTVTAATVVGETNGFSTIENKRQLVSYAGYDVIVKESGTSIRSKPRISKKGNRHIRKAMHFPALAAIKTDPANKNHFTRLVQKHGIKMKAAVAIQRKLLVLLYTLWKNEQYYDPNFIGQNDKKEIGQQSCPNVAGSVSA
jgi:transposase